MQKKIKILHCSDIGMARREAKSMAEAIGFDEMASEEIALVVSELASNLINHARRGILNLTSLDETGGIRIESLDRGPGIADTEAAIKNGFSTTGSMGYGLGTVNRLMDRLQIDPQKGTDGLTHIICERSLRNMEHGEISNPLDIGAVTRAYPGLAVNGDAFFIKHWNKNALVALIDGLGHGQFAHKAAQRARQYVENYYDQPLEEVFRGVDRSCRETRGIVMALARFDWERQKLTFANVGNVEARTIGNAEHVKFTIRRGIVGINAPKPAITEHPWKPSYIMVLHTDGLTTRWESKDFSHLWYKPANNIAQELLRSLAKDFDDATVVVVKGKNKLFRKQDSSIISGKNHE